ncbi:MAG: hypothetical protein GXO83_00985 [Chlorobi bacterium]|nr:hypothetical protein [Chlorobiota bacterium]
MKYKLFSIGIGFIVLLSCCSGQKGEKKAKEFVIPDTLAASNTAVLAEEVTSDIIDNLASPVEIAGLLDMLGVPYSNAYLASSSDINNMNTEIQQAYGLGIYGADLGYQAMYGQNTALLDYISNIKRLADNLMIGQFFDYNTLKRLAGNKENLDSLMFIAVHSFNEIDRYLRKSQRGEISALVITGLWIEGIYLATQVQQSYPHEELKERIGEQKIVMEDLFVLLDRYKSNPEVKKITGQLDQLKQLFDQVEITIIPGEPETVEKDGRLVVVQHEESKVSYSDELLQQIIQQTVQLRERLLHQ